MEQYIAQHNELVDLLGKLYSAQQLADFLGVDVVTIYRKIKKGEIKAVRIGRDYKISAKDVKQYLDKCLVKVRV